MTYDGSDDELRAYLRVDDPLLLEAPIVEEVHTAMGRGLRALAYSPLLDILPAMNDQDTNRSPGDNVLRFAFHRQGQNSQVSTRCHGMPCRGLTLVLTNSAGLGYRPTRSNVQPSTDREKGFLPALNGRVSTLGVR